jgi:hypothetical protein
MCLIKYAHLENIFRLVGNIVRGLQLQLKSCVVDSCLFLLRMSDKYGVSTVKVGYIHIPYFFLLIFTITDLNAWKHFSFRMSFGYTKACKAWIGVWYFHRRLKI